MFLVKYLHFLFVLFLITSCCTKQDCDGIDEFTLVEFKDFPDVEELQVLGYVANTNFTDLIYRDTSETDFSGDDFYVTFNKGIDFYSDYKFILPSGEEITLTDIDVERTTCNNCFPKNPESDYYLKLESYRVNGVLIEDVRGFVINK